MNILILEDEVNAAIRLTQLLAEVAPEAVVVHVAEGVKDTLDWLKHNAGPDLILSDIQLADGLSLDVFSQAEVKAPVIFTTAYDAYALKAFKLNSIDYLLKPIDKEELKTAFAKYRAMHAGANWKVLADTLKQVYTGKPNYKMRFLVKQGERLITVPIEEVAYLRADDKVVFLHTRKGDKYFIDDSLDELENMLDPAVFFRLNRTYIAPLDSIERINSHFNGRLKIGLRSSTDDDIFVSKARAGAFKDWLNR
jgi:DNA-binding LytR/AlgR family response regulator